MTDTNQPQDSLPENRMPVIRVPARPADQNPGGSMFGGWIMSYVDIAGSIPALNRVRGPVVTRAVDSFEFKKPVFVGDLISCYAEIVYEGRTSMKVKVEVYAESMKKGEISCVKVTEAQAVPLLMTDKALYLKAISAGAVFFGAFSYIGNAPNFMVRSISEEAGTPMPSFFGYILKYAVVFLLPVFGVVTLIFF